MIDGFKIKISSSELRSHCQARRDYHKRRAEEKENTIPELRKSLEMLRDDKATSVGAMSKGRYMRDPEETIAQVESEITDHRNKSLVFAFYAEHLFDEDYTLEETDLIRLEVLKRY